MKIRLGVDVGGSTTKIVGFAGETMLGALQVRAADQVTSLYGAVGRFLQETGRGLADVEAFALTGVGASFFGAEIYGVPLRKVNEFEAIGRGGLLLSGLEEAVVASVGTGSAFVRAGAEGLRHLGGSGVGGGTLHGLSTLLLSEHDMNRVSALARAGDAGNVDLLVGAISHDEIPSLPKSATAANFGAVNPTTRREDVAAGIINLVAQTVGMLAVFACRGEGLRDVVMTGTAAVLPQYAEVMDAIREMSGVRFHIPENAVFATAIGALCAP